MTVPTLEVRMALVEQRLTAFTEGQNQLLEEMRALRADFSTSYLRVDIERLHHDETIGAIERAHKRISELTMELDRRSTRFEQDVATKADVAITAEIRHDMDAMASNTRWWWRTLGVLFITPLAAELIRLAIYHHI